MKTLEVVNVNGTDYTHRGKTLVNGRLMDIVVWENSSPTTVEEQIEKGFLSIVDDKIISKRGTIVCLVYGINVYDFEFTSENIYSSIDEFHASLFGGASNQLVGLGVLERLKELNNGRYQYKRTDKFPNLK